MKKSFIVALMAFVCSLSACADDQLVTFAQLPVAAQNTVKQYFDEANIAFCTLDREFLGKEYKVQFNDGSEIKFEGDGSLHIRQQVKASFPQAVIVEWGKDDRGWKAELSNQLELKFNSKYQMSGVDD